MGPINEYSEGAIARDMGKQHRCPAKKKKVSHAQAFAETQGVIIQQGSVFINASFPKGHVW